MAYTASNVTTAKQGATSTISIAPVGTALPTNATTALNAAFKALGHISEDGVTFSISRDSQDIKNMDGTTVYTPQTSVAGTIQFGLLEGLSVDAKGAMYGVDNVSGTLPSGITATFSGAEPDEVAIVFESILRGGVLHRVVVPRAKLTDTGDVVYKGDEGLIYDLTYTAMANDENELWNEYTAKPSTNP